MIVVFFCFCVENILFPPSFIWIPMHSNTELCNKRRRGLLLFTLQLWALSSLSSAVTELYVLRSLSGPNWRY